MKILTLNPMIIIQALTRLYAIIYGHNIAEPNYAYYIWMLLISAYNTGRRRRRPLSFLYVSRLNLSAVSRHIKYRLSAYK